MYHRYLLLTALQLVLVFSFASSFASPKSFSRTNRMPLRGGFSTPTNDEENPAESSSVMQEPTGSQLDDPAAVLSPPVQDTPVSKYGPNGSPPGILRRTFPSAPWQIVPDYLTYVRCIAIPIMIALFYMPDKHVWTGTLFAVASFTDWLDGYLARRWDISTAFGAFLDPVADKLMVSTSLILLAGRYGAKAAIPAAIILAREISVSALREWMAQKGLRDIVKVGYQGKVKTALTMLSLTLLLFVPENGVGFLGKLLQPSLIMLYLSTGITLTSGSVYFRAAAPILMSKDTTP